MTGKGKASYFITGFPGFMGKRLVTLLARQRRDASIFLLVEPEHAAEAKRCLRGLHRPGRFELLQGDVADMHLGLSGAEYARVCDEVTEIFHLAALRAPGASRELSRRVNVEGTRNVLELARDCRGLERLSHFSTAFVAGDRIGVVAEDELDLGQGFRSAYEETAFQAEKLVRRVARELPVIVFRPSLVIGDSRTGEVDRFEGPLALGPLLLGNSFSKRSPLTGTPAPLHVVPVDFVIAAALKLSQDPRAIGRTFHLVDPSPMSSRRVLELIAERLHQRLPRPGVQTRAASALLWLRLLEKRARPQRTALERLSQLTFFNCQNTLELLEGTGLRCPPITEYLPRLVDYVEALQAQRRDDARNVEDPLDAPQRGDVSSD